MTVAATLTMKAVGPFVVIQFGVALVIGVAILNYRSRTAPRVGGQAYRYGAYLALALLVLGSVAMEIIAFSLLTADL